MQENWTCDGKKRDDEETKNFYIASHPIALRCAVCIVWKLMLLHIFTCKRIKTMIYASLLSCCYTVWLSSWWFGWCHCCPHSEFYFIIFNWTQWNVQTLAWVALLLVLLLSSCTSLQNCYKWCHKSTISMSVSVNYTTTLKYLFFVSTNEAFFLLLVLYPFDACHFFSLKSTIWLFRTDWEKREIGAHKSRSFYQFSRKTRPMATFLSHQSCEIL